MGQEQPAVRQTCWQRAVHAYGSAAIFERRAQGLQRRLKALTFLGIAVPVTVGGVIMSFGLATPNLGTILIAAGVLSIAQLVGSIWSLVSRWDSSLAYALESATENHRLSSQFEKLGVTAPADLAVRFEWSEAAYQARSDTDVRQTITPSEKRYGLRVGLQRFQRSCVACGQIPDPGRPTACSTCGK